MRVHYETLVVPTIENGEERCIRVCFSFFIFFPSIKNGEELCIRVGFSFFGCVLLFPRKKNNKLIEFQQNHKPQTNLVSNLLQQNQVPQIIIGLGRLIYHIKALSIAIRTTFKNFQNIFPVSRKTGLKFLIFVHFRTSQAIE